MTTPHRNAFGGENHDGVQVLKSAAGYYVGRLYYDAELGGYLPYSRDSYGYYASREEAEAHLKYYEDLNPDNLPRLD